MGEGGVFGAELALEGIEAARPEGTHVLEPVFEFVEAAGVDHLDAGLALGADGDETGLAEDLEVLGDRRGAQLELLDQLTGGAIPLGEQLDDATSGGIGDGSEALHAENN